MQLEQLESCQDSEIFFSCPYDSLTVYDGPTNKHPIIRKVCGLQQRLEIYSFGPNAFIEFNTTSPTKADPRGYFLVLFFLALPVDIFRKLQI